MTRTLIVNADDYGRTRAVSDGIRRAHAVGIVTTTTVMMNMPAAAEGLRQACTHTPRLGLGVHLNLTSGRPCADRVPSLVGPTGLFHSVQDLLADPERVNLGEVEREWRAQIARFLESGAALDHLDSHHHAAATHPALWELCLTLAAEYRVGVRPPWPADEQTQELTSRQPASVRQFASDGAVRRLRASGLPHPEHFFAGFFGAGATLGNLLAILRRLPPGTSEIMCHPGEVDPELRAGSGYAAEREVELMVLTHPAVRAALAETGVVPATYREAWPEPA